MVAILAPQVPLAYLAARFAVARARRGDIPDWRRLFAWLGPLADALSLRRDRFPSARKRSNLVRMAAARPVAAGVGGNPVAVRAGPAVRDRQHTSTRLCATRRCADHATVHGDLRRRDRAERESSGAGRLRAVAVPRHTAVDQRRARRRQAESDDLEHGRGVGAGAHRHPVGAGAVGHLAGGDPANSSRGRHDWNDPHGRGPAADAVGPDPVDLEAARAESVHRPDRPSATHQGERVRHAGTAVSDRAHSPVDHRQQARREHDLGHVASGAGDSRRAQDVRGRLDGQAHLRAACSATARW